MTLVRTLLLAALLAAVPAVGLVAATGSATG